MATAADLIIALNALTALFSARPLLAGTVMLSPKPVMLSEVVMFGGYR